MKESKQRIAVLCGGQSAEHEVSLESAKNVIQALDKTRYDVDVIVVTQKGEWLLLDTPHIILNNQTMQPLTPPFAAQRVIFQFGQTHPLAIIMQGAVKPLAIDAIFPVIHGTHGEDGALQGLLEMANIPYVGAGVLGSAVCMDKDASKRLLRDSGIPVARWITVSSEEAPNLLFDQVVEQLGLPLFVKPCNTGSSVGISKVKTRAEFAPALQLALQYDQRIMLEEYIMGREIECSILGNSEIDASLPGEIIPQHEFYSYEAKYLDPNGAILQTPAELFPDVVEKIRTIAKEAFSVLCCEGMARVDFFLTADGKVFLNEANTIPGFTQISQYPNMWRVSGLAYPDLIDRLLELALVRFNKKRSLLP